MVEVKHVEGGLDLRLVLAQLAHRHVSGKFVHAERGKKKKKKKKEEAATNEHQAAYNEER
jgi:hypothetical protein